MAKCKDCENILLRKPGVIVSKVGAKHAIIKDEKSIVIEKPLIKKSYVSKSYTPEKSIIENDSIFENNKEEIE